MLVSTESQVVTAFLGCSGCPIAVDNAGVEMSFFMEYSDRRLENIFKTAMDFKALEGLIDNGFPVVQICPFQWVALSIDSLYAGTPKCS